MIRYKEHREDYGSYTIIRLFTRRSNRLIGKIHVDREDRRCSIWSLYVESRFEKQGFGTCLLQEAEKVAIEKYNRNIIYLYCYSHRLSFYLDRGYMPTNRYNNPIKYDMLKIVREE